MLINRVILSAFFLLIFTEAHANCEFTRFPDLAKLMALKEKIPAEFQEYNLQRKGIERKRIDERKERNSPPINIELYGSADNIAGNSFESAEVRLSYDINIPLQLLNRKRSKLLDLNYSRRLSNIDLEENAFFLQKALSWHYARKQKNLYSSRYEVLQKQLKYFEEKKKQGASVISDISRNKLELISLKNKILAVQSRIEMASFELPFFDNPLFQKVELDWLPSQERLNCPLISYEKNLARDNVEFYKTQKKIDWLQNTMSISAYASKNIFNKSEGPSIGLGLNFNILSTKERGRAVRSSDASIDESFRDLQIAEIRLRKLFKEQASVEALIFENIHAINSEIIERKRILRELQTRASLGQTIFEEQSSALLELSNLQEVKIQRIFDLYMGWVQFIQVRGIVDSEKLDE